MSIDLSKIRTLSFGSGVNRVEVYPKTIVNAITDENGKPLETYIEESIGDNIRNFLDGSETLNFVKKEDVYTKEEIDDALEENLSNYVLKTEYEEEIEDLRSTIIGTSSSASTNLENLYAAIGNDPEFYKTVDAKLELKADKATLDSYYTKTEVDSKVANIDLSQYYTKTEVDTSIYALETNISTNFATKSLVRTEVSNLNKTLKDSYTDNTELDSLLSEKVDKQKGKTLTSNDFTDETKAKLDGIEENANNYVHPSSHNASMITGLHRVATTGDYENLANKPSNLSEFHNDCNYVTEAALEGFGDRIEDSIETMDHTEVNDLLYFIFH